MLKSSAVLAKMSLDILASRNQVLKKREKKKRAKNKFCSQIIYRKFKGLPKPVVSDLRDYLPNLSGENLAVPRSAFCSPEQNYFT